MNVTIYNKDKKGVWWLQYSVGGKRYRKSTGLRSKTDAQRLAKQKERELREGVAEEQKEQKSGISLDEFWGRCLKHAKHEKRPKTVDNEVRLWMRFRWWLGLAGITRLGDVKCEHVRQYRGWLLSEEIDGSSGVRKRKAPLSRSSVNVHHRHLSAIFSYGVECGWIDINPWKQTKKLKVDEEAKSFLDIHEIENVMKCAEQHSRNMYLVFALGLYAGLRKSEIANARWEWFDLGNELIVIQACGAFAPKGHRMVAVPMMQRLKAILVEYKNGSDEGYLFPGNVPENERKNLIRYDFKNGFNTVKKAAGIEWLTPHILRHTFASQFAIANVSLLKIQHWLGHADPRTTMRYAHLQAHDEDINLEWGKRRL